MFFNPLKMGELAIVAVLAFAVGYSIGHMRGEASGAAKAELRLTNLTNKAIEELSNEADQMRVARRYCIDRGGVFNFASGDCEKTNAE